MLFFSFEELHEILRYPAPQQFIPLLFGQLQEAREREDPLERE